MPRWAGGKMPLSSELADASLRELAGAMAGRFDARDAAARPMLETAGAALAHPDAHGRC